LNVPAELKVRLYDPVVIWAEPLPSANVTVWGTDPTAQVHCTVWPTLTVSLRPFGL
jgi:hypothetical protein